MGSQTKHKHLLEHNTWSSTQTTNTTGQQLHNIQKQHTHSNHKDITSAFNKHYTSQNQHHKQENNKANAQIHITTEQVQTAIKSSKNNYSTGPDNINIKHLKHIGKLGINYLTNLYNAALNDNKIPHDWKFAKIIPVPKPNKDINTETSYRPISLLSVIAKTLGNVILPYITQNIPIITTQHGFKTKHSTNTALHNINNTVATGFNQSIPPTRTIAVALDMSKAFDTVNIHPLIDKLTHTNISHTIHRKLHRLFPHWRLHQ